MNQINVNIKFNEEEKIEWIKYHNRLDKFNGYSTPFSIIAFISTFTIYLLVIIDYEGTYLDISHSLIFIFTEGFIIKVTTFELILIHLLFQGLAVIGRKRQDIAKQMVIKIEPEGNMIELSIKRLKTGKVLYHNYFNVLEFINTMCNKDNDKIVINNVEYIIGKNDKKYINKNNTKNLCNDIPQTKPSDINDINELIKLLTKLYGCQSYNRRW